LLGNNYKFLFIDLSRSMTKCNNNLFLSNRVSPVIVRSCGRRRPVREFAGEPAVSGQPTVFRTTTGFRAAAGCGRFARGIGFEDAGAGVGANKTGKFTDTGGRKFGV